MKSYREAGKRIGRVLALAGLLVVLWPAGFEAAGAATFENLYTVSVTLDRNLPATERQRDAVRRAMAVLLTRVTGIRDVTRDPALAEMVRNADRYRDSTLLSNDEVRVGFLRTPVNDALAELDVPTWGEERPATLLWIAVDFGAGERAELAEAPSAPGRSATAFPGQATNALSDAAASAFAAVTSDLIKAADERGLPIVLPRLDAVDRRIVRFADVWGGFDRFVEQAAERYAVDAILIARVSVRDDEARVRWILSQDGEARSLAALEPRAGIDWLADQLAAQFTIVGDARLTEIRIQDIATAQDFVRVIQYLESLSIVDSVYEVSLSTDNELQLRAAVRGDDENLRRVLTLGGVLRASDDATALDASLREPFVPEALGISPGQRELVFRPSWLAPETTIERQ